MMICVFQYTDYLHFSQFDLCIYYIYELVHTRYRYILSILYIIRWSYGNLSMIPTMVNIFQAALGTLVDARLANAWELGHYAEGNTTSDSRSEVNDVYVYLIHVEINVELHYYM